MQYINRKKDKRNWPLIILLLVASMIAGIFGLIEDQKKSQKEEKDDSRYESVDTCNRDGLELSGLFI